jgi:uncharacterized protein
MTRDDIIAELRARADRLKANGATGLFLYGSRARGDNKPDSDLDLFMDYDPARVKSYLDFLTFELDLQDKLGFEVHLAGRDDLHPLIRNNVEAQAIQVF